MQSSKPKIGLGTLSSGGASSSLAELEEALPEHSGSGRDELRGVVGRVFKAHVHRRFFREGGRAGFPFGAEMETGDAAEDRPSPSSLNLPAKNGSVQVIVASGPDSDSKLVDGFRLHAAEDGPTEPCAFRTGEHTFDFFRRDAAEDGAATAFFFAPFFFTATAFFFTAFFTVDLGDRRVGGFGDRARQVVVADLPDRGLAAFFLDGEGEVVVDRGRRFRGEAVGRGHVIGQGADRVGVFRHRADVRVRPVDL